MSDHLILKELDEKNLELNNIKREFAEHQKEFYDLFNSRETLYKENISLNEELSDSNTIVEQQNHQIKEQKNKLTHVHKLIEDYESMINKLREDKRHSEHEKYVLRKDNEKLMSQQPKKEKDKNWFYKMIIICLVFTLGWHFGDMIHTAFTHRKNIEHINLEHKNDMKYLKTKYKLLGNNLREQVLGE